MGERDILDQLELLLQPEIELRGTEPLLVRDLEQDQLAFQLQPGLGVLGGDPHLGFLALARLVGDLQRLELDLDRGLLALFLPFVVGTHGSPQSLGGLLGERQVEEAVQFFLEVLLDRLLEGGRLLGDLFEVFAGVPLFRRVVFDPSADHLQRDFGLDLEVADVFLTEMFGLPDLGLFVDLRGGLLEFEERPLLLLALELRLLALLLGERLQPDPGPRF